jgi:hypothetical protein
MQNQRMPKQIATTTMEGTRKRGSVKDGDTRLNVMGIRTGKALTRERQEWRKIIGSQDSQRAFALERRRRRRRRRNKKNCR